MTDLRARLADALRERLPKSEVLGPIYVKEMADVLADAALSLPGIAIVDTDADVDWIAERMADANDGIIYGLLTPDEAEFYRRMARAALLAANAAEQESK